MTADGGAVVATDWAPVGPRAARRSTRGSGRPGTTSAAVTSLSTAISRSRRPTSTASKRSTTGAPATSRPCVPVPLPAGPVPLRAEVRERFRARPPDRYRPHRPKGREEAGAVESRATVWPGRPTRRRGPKPRAFERYRLPRDTQLGTGQTMCLCFLV